MPLMFMGDHYGCEISTTCMWQRYIYGLLVTLSVVRYLGCNDGHKNIVQ
jgi:hypothetical protein